MATSTTLTRSNETLYAVALVVNDELSDDTDYNELDVINAEVEAMHYEPEGWPEYALDVWGDTPQEGEHWPNGYKPFFWPSTKRLYKTRVAAEGRANLINRWGGNAVVVVAEIDWIPIAIMDHKWERERLENIQTQTAIKLASLGPVPVIG